MTVCATPAEAATGAEVVVTMLFDADADADADAVVEAMGAGALAAMSEGAVWVQASTVGAEGCDRLAALAAGASIAFVDAPVLGTKEPAEAGQLAVLASGPEDVRERVQPVLDAIGTTKSWLGEAGVGSRLEVVVNARLLAVTAGTATSLRVAERLGVDGRSFLDAIAGSPVDSAYAQLKGKAMIDGHFEPSFALRGAQKDAGLAVDAAGGPGLRLLDAIVADAAAAVDSGHGDDDLAALWFGVGS